MFCSSVVLPPPPPTSCCISGRYASTDDVPDPRVSCMSGEEMGLLTDPNNRQRGLLAQLILNHYNKLSWLLYCAGLLYFQFQIITLGESNNFCVRQFM